MNAEQEFLDKQGRAKLDGESDDDDKVDKTKDEVYRQRNLLAQALASVFPYSSGVRERGEAWPVLVLRVGRKDELSFHIPRRDWSAGLLARLAPASEWDGKSTWATAEAALFKRINHGYGNE